MMRIGLYPGTFDPITIGHIDIIQRATHLVDCLVVGVAENQSQKTPLFSLDERYALVADECYLLQQKTQCELRIETFSGLLVDYAAKTGARMIIRGLRNTTDFEFEFQMITANRTLNKSIDTVLLTAEARNATISSHLIKEIARLGGDVSCFVTPHVKTALLAKYSIIKTMT